MLNTSEWMPCEFLSSKFRSAKCKMEGDCYPLSDVLAIASVHPFYSDVVYPPTREELPSVLAKARESGNDELTSFPLTHKEQLYCISLIPPSNSLLTVQIFTNRTPHSR